MIAVLKNMPNNVFGFLFENHITDDDYRTVLIPAIEAAISNKNNTRIFIEIGNTFKSMSMKSMLDDSFVGHNHFFNWERVAIISNHDRINHMIAAFSFLMPSKIKVFNSWHREKAIKWITAHTLN